MRRDLPANPLAIQLTAVHERLWWQLERADEQPERWDVSANIWGLEDTDREARHVGDISLALADLTMERTLIDASVLGDWATEFIDALVADPTRGTLHPDLERQVNPGPPHLVVVRRISITRPWRGYGLGAALTASALLLFARYARLAACHVSPENFAGTGHDPVSADLASVRIGGMLESMGFHHWNGAYVLDLRNPSLLETRRRVITQWWPDDEQTGPV
ncbi:hypothetical protein [Amycolatopsis alkalitolerans]|uniref:Uncharacterized protein n=1 Tax=Amycolatopsis alkalitolerans TaxID=2547244 RepID=A0A5C4LUY0_9PSEU|nr:hypothetical protein [Amycolatopsis alkalitolerans]TNC22246.1 hypothetical protein FG385_26085 [Amycolatopsis alkalitolerans]